MWYITRGEGWAVKTALVYCYEALDLDCIDLIICIAVRCTYKETKHIDGLALSIGLP